MGTKKLVTLFMIPKIVTLIAVRQNLLCMYPIKLHYTNKNKT